MTDESILAALRERTRPYHKRLESRVDILGALASRERYAALIARFYGLYKPLEPVLYAFPNWEAIGFRVGLRLKLPLLERDLIALGLGQSQISGLACCHSPVALPDFGRALGCAYVLEGSTLGGQLIARQLHAIGVTPTSGGRFFSSYGASVGRMWADFREMLDAQTQFVDAEAVIAGARDTFVAFERWLETGQANDRDDQVSDAPGIG